MEISFTQFRVYLECPWKYKLIFVDRQRIPLNPASSLGASLHRALECFHRSKVQDLDALLGCYERRWVKAGYPTEESRVEHFEKGRRILERYLKEESSRRTEVVGIEREFVYPLGEHTVRGMVDRIDRHPDGRHEVIDYKTQLEGGIEGAAALQLRFYALGVKEALAIEPSLLTVHSLAAGRRETLPYDPSGEEELKESILRTANRIEAGDFRPDTSFCPSCDFRMTCAHSVARNH